jgi:antitoxin component of MazEF toxin-antitoxin module
MSAEISKAELLVPKTGYGGRRYDTRGKLKGHDGVWFRASKRGSDHYRVVKARTDGKSEDTSYRVRASDFVEDNPSQEGGGGSHPETSPTRPIFSVIGQRGTLTLSAANRDRYGFEEGSAVIEEPREDGLLIRPADVTPRVLVPGISPNRAPSDLARLVEAITPENCHDEVDFGPAVGRELL